LLFSFQRPTLRTSNPEEVGAATTFGYRPFQGAEILFRTASESISFFVFLSGKFRRLFELLKAADRKPNSLPAALSGCVVARGRNMAIISAPGKPNFHEE
jgi:hypothetical protein